MMRNIVLFILGMTIEINIQTQIVPLVNLAVREYNKNLLAVLNDLRAGKLNYELQDAIKKQLIKRYSKLFSVPAKIYIHYYKMSSIALNSDARYALGVVGKVAYLLDLKNFETVVGYKIIQGHTGAITSVALSSCGRYALTGSQDKIARTWDVETGQTIKILKGHTNVIASVAFSQCSRYALTTSYDNTARLWDLATGETIKIFPHTRWVRSAALSPCGNYIVTGSQDGVTYLWNVKTGHIIQTFEGHTASVLSVAFSQCGKYILTNAEDKTIYLWELSARKDIIDTLWNSSSEKHRTKLNLDGWVRSVVISPDGTQALSQGYRYDAYLWDLATGKTIMKLDNCSAWISVIFSQNGKYILGLSGNILYLWDLDYWHKQDLETVINRIQKAKKTN